MCICMFLHFFGVWQIFCLYILLFSTKCVPNHVDQVFTAWTLFHTYHASVVMYRTVCVHCLIDTLIYLYHKPSSVCTLRNRPWRSTKPNKDLKPSCFFIHKMGIQHLQQFFQKIMQNMNLVKHNNDANTESRQMSATIL